jgi:hypothetical protein
LRCARWYCLEQAGQRCDGRTAGQILGRLMTEYWDDIGRWNWIQDDLLGGDDFSGTGPELPE